MRLLGIGLAVVWVIGLAACAQPEASPTPASPTPIPTAPATATPAPTATPTPSPTPASVAPGPYLALGDSLAVGAGATRPDATGYVARLSRALTVTTLHNLAVGGETSASMIRRGQLADALGLIAEVEPTLVTLDIGGNDLLALLRTDACRQSPMGADCLQQLALTLDNFEANYRQILEELTDALADHAPAARLAVMTYFNPFSGTDAAYEAAAELALLGRDDRLDCEADAPGAHGMNDIIACIGEELGATAVDVQPRFEGLGLELTHIGSEDIHANDPGYEVIAEEFVRALEP